MLAPGVPRRHFPAAAHDGRQEGLSEAASGRSVPDLELEAGVSPHGQRPCGCGAGVAVERFIEVVRLTKELVLLMRFMGILMFTADRHRALMIP